MTGKQKSKSKKVTITNKELSSSVVDYPIYRKFLFLIIPTQLSMTSSK